VKANDGDHSYIAAINNEKTNGGGGLWIGLDNNTNNNDALRLSNSTVAEDLFRIGSQSGVFIAYDKLPAVDPGEKGQVYRDNNNFLKISAG
jgi:hypothetical protein